MLRERPDARQLTPGILTSGTSCFPQTPTLTLTLTLTSGCLCVRIPGVSCLASGRSRLDVPFIYRQFGSLKCLKTQVQMVCIIFHLINDKSCQFNNINYILY